MKLLILSGPFYPTLGNNANLIGKLIPYLQAGHEVHIATMTAADEAKLPKTCFGVPVHWMRDQKRGIVRKYVLPLYAKMADRSGYSDAMMIYSTVQALREIRQDYAFDAVISTSEPFYAVAAAAKFTGVKRITYLMDPPESISGAAGTAYRNRNLVRILRCQDGIVTTPFICRALSDHGYWNLESRETAVGFPIVELHSQAQCSRIHMDPEKINLLFCGWLYSDIRSPAYFLKLAETLDERFCIWFMGRECDKLRERFSFRTKSEVVTLPQQPYAVALDAMNQADILINISNSVPVHMPSKTLEYINTGKPFVNFYKMDDCPTLYYTERYPLCLNLNENDWDWEHAAESFRQFCLDRKGQTVGRAWIEEQYRECTPCEIAKKICDYLE